LTPDKQMVTSESRLKVYFDETVLHVLVKYY